MASAHFTDLKVGRQLKSQPVDTPAIIVVVVFVVVVVVIDEIATGGAFPIHHAVEVMYRGDLVRYRRVLWEREVHFALGLDGRRRHGTDGRRADERERRKPAFPGTRQKLENFRVVETRRDVSSVSLETLRVTNHLEYSWSCSV